MIASNRVRHLLPSIFASDLADHFTACGSLARGKDRPIRNGDSCECDEGWTGINCNVCTQDNACNPLMETKEGGVCYQNGEVVNENHQMCGVTNEKILTMLEGKIPQATFTCEKESGICDFQCKCKAIIPGKAMTWLTVPIE